MSNILGALPPHIPTLLLGGAGDRRRRPADLARTWVLVMAAVLAVRNGGTNVLDGMNDVPVEGNPSFEKFAPSFTLRGSFGDTDEAGQAVTVQQVANTVRESFGKMPCEGEEEEEEEEQEDEDLDEAEGDEEEDDDSCDDGDEGDDDASSELDQHEP